jgi:WD40 repeat protein
MQGDSFHFCFSEAAAAVLAAADGQRALAANGWESEPIKVRIGLHTGEPVETDGLYAGLDVHLAARVMSVAYGGQVLISETTRQLVDGGVDDGIGFRDLGPHELKDFPEPQQLYQVTVPGLVNEFPPLKAGSRLPAAAGLPDYSLPPADVPCPYKGLGFFESSDAELYFGREELVESLGDRLEERPLLIVVGASGSGKSSLARAGLAPALERRARAAGPELPVLVVTPGACTSGELRARAYAAAPPRLIVVDQLEELFTLREDGEREAFLDTFFELVDARDGTRVVALLRADFYGHCTAHPRLAEALGADQVLLGPMTEAELRRAIEAPAARVGLTLEPGLTEAMVKDVLGEPGGLPLLSHCLLETWKRRSDRLLTVIGYLQAGGAHGAIAKTAEHVFEHELTVDEQAVARRIFMRLAQPGDGTEDTRRRAEMHELVAPAGGAEEVQHVLDVLARARLITVSKDTVDVAHEAVIRHWPRFRDWLEEDREGWLLHRKLTEAATEWRSLGRDPGALLRGNRLAATADWAAGPGQDQVSALEREFLEASRSAAVTELEQARRRNRRLRVLVAGLAVLVAVAGALAWISLDQRNQAQKESRIALSRGIAGQALGLLDQRPDQALLLALEAYRREPTAEARSSLLTAIQQTRLLERILSGRQEAVTSLAFTPDRSLLATGGTDGRVALWDLKTGRARRLTIVQGRPVVALAVSRDGSRLAAASDRGMVGVFRTGTGGEIARFTAHESGPVAALAFTTPAELASIGPFDATMKRWRLEPRVSQLASTPIDSRSDSVAAFDPAGRFAAVELQDGAVAVLDVLRGSVSARVRFPGVERTTALALSAGARVLAVGAESGAVRLRDLRAGRDPASPSKAAGAVRALALSPGATLLAVAAERGAVRVWSLSRHDYVGSSWRGDPEGVTAVAFRGEGEVAAAGFSGTTALWRTDGTSPLQRAIPGLSSTIDGALNPDGTVLAAAQRDGSLRLVDLDQGRASDAPSAGLTFAVAFAPSGELLATVGQDRVSSLVRFLNPADGSPLGPPVSGTSEHLTALAFDPSGRRVTASGNDGSVTTWDVQSRRRVGTPTSLHIDSIESIAYDPRGNWLATAGRDRLVRLVATAARPGSRLTLRGHEDIVTAVVFTPDGQRVASASLDSTVRLWRVETARPDGQPLDAEVGALLSLAVSPDGRVLAAIGERAVVFWDLASRRILGGPLLLDRPPGTEAPSRALFTPDGKSFLSLTVTGAFDWGAALWTSDYEPLHERVCALVGRSLTEAEWRELVPDLPYRRQCSP